MTGAALETAAWVAEAASFICSGVSWSPERSGVTLVLGRIPSPDGCPVCWPACPWDWLPEMRDWSRPGCTFPATPLLLSPAPPWTGTAPTPVVVCCCCCAFVAPLVCCDAIYPVVSWPVKAWWMALSCSSCAPLVLWDNCSKICAASSTEPTWAIWNLAAVSATFSKVLRTESAALSGLKFTLTSLPPVCWLALFMARVIWFWVPFIAPTKSAVAFAASWIAGPNTGLPKKSQRWPSGFGRPTCSAIKTARSASFCCCCAANSAWVCCWFCCCAAACDWAISEVPPLTAGAEDVIGGVVCPPPVKGSTVVALVWLSRRFTGIAVGGAPVFVGVVPVFVCWNTCWMSLAAGWPVCGLVAVFDPGIKLSLRLQPPAPPPIRPPRVAPPTNDSLNRSIDFSLKNCSVGSTAMRPAWFTPSCAVSWKPSLPAVTVPVAAVLAKTPLAPGTLSRKLIELRKSWPRPKAPSTPNTFKAA